LKEAYGQNKIDPSEFKASLLEVSSLRKQLSDAEKEKAQVQEEWMKKFEQSERRKAEEINELKVKKIWKKFYFKFEKIKESFFRKNS